ncbi:LysE family translocator [Hoeflea sp. TYP-13]|uniref:LysE family translocator n=1 Tax=Hoeflea sp. TYP-13 TaxID=3230023 RepID=UPI0034C5C5D5
MDWSDWSAFALISMVTIVTPGPGNMNTTRRAAQLGLLRVFPGILGNTLGLGLVGTICAAGLVTFVLQSGLLWNMLHWLAAGYLAWLGLRFILKNEAIEPTGNLTPGVSGKFLFGEAFLLAFSNPKAILYFTALLPQFVNPARLLAPQMAIMLLTCCAISVASQTVYSTLASLLRTHLHTPNRFFVFRAVSGFILLAFAGKLVLGF